MITKRAIRVFMERKRLDYSMYKGLSDHEIDYQKSLLPTVPPIWSKLKKHQKVCFLLGAKLQRFGFFNDTGTGKSVLSIALIKYFIRKKTVKRVLVLVPNKTNKYEWEDEIRKHSPITKFITLAGSSQDKWSDILENPDVQIVMETYAGLIRMVCKRVKTKKGEIRLKPSVPMLTRLLKTFDGLVMDESQNIKNSRKLPYRICRQLSKTAKIVFALSGTPMGRDPHDLWSQLYVIDKGETLGETLGLFRGAFFKSSMNRWGGMEYDFDRSKEEVLNKFIANRTIRIEADQADLPATSRIIKRVARSDDSDAFFERTRLAIIASKGDFKETQNAFLRMRQISSGFVGYDDEEEGKRAQLEFDPNPKLELLISLITSINPEYKFLVFHDFTFSGSMICRELEELDISHLRLYGKTKDPAAVLNQFKNDPKVRGFIIQSQAGGAGLNLQMARYGFYYESPVSPISRKQTEGRFIRQHSLHEKVFLYDLVMHGTFDQRILDFHAEGKDLFDAILNGEERL